MSKATERGTALIELSLVIPMLLIALLGSIEITRIFEATQKVATTSRETANILHRNCFYAPDPSPGVWGPGACVTTPAQSLVDLNGPTYAYMNTVLPGMQMLVSVYKLDTTTLPWSVTLASSMSTPGYNATLHPSRYQPTANYANFGVSALSATKQHVIIVESYHRYTSFLGLAKKFNLVPSLMNIYEATIF